MSVGLLMDVIPGSPDLWRQIKVKGLLEKSPEGKNVVSAWRWRGSKIRLRVDWWTQETDPLWQFMFENEGVSKYAEAVKATMQQPDADHPMHWLSPAMALHLARMLNCRLPTSAEWAAAMEQETAGDEEIRWNLADETWATQDAHIRELQSGQRPIWPVKGIFGRASRDKSAAYDDGLLWFAPVDSETGGTFRHLIGNVAEFVLDGPVEPADTFASPDDATPEAVVDFLSQLLADGSAQAGALGVVGGSALSGPKLWNGQDRPFSKKAPIQPSGVTKSYCDVGVRLAFTAPSESAASILRNVLNDRANYLAPVSEGAP